MLFVGDFTNGCTALNVDLADFTRTHAHLGVNAFARQQRSRCASRTRNLRTFARLQLDAVNSRTDRNIADRQGVTHADWRFGATNNTGTHFQIARCNVVAALAINVAHQRDVRRTVGIVFDAFDLGGDAVLVVAHEIDHTVVVTVAAALVTDGDVAVVVTASLLELRLQQRRITFALMQLVARNLHHVATARRSWFNLNDSHD